MTISPFPLPVLLLALTALPALAEDAFREEFATIDGWTAQPSWVGNASSAATLAAGTSNARFAVPEPRRGMKWSHPCTLRVDARFRYLTLNYRAEHLAMAEEFALHLAAPQADAQPIRLRQLTADGQWHVLTVPVTLEAGVTARDYQGITIGVESDDAGGAVLEIDWIALSDKAPGEG